MPLVIFFNQLGILLFWTSYLAWVLTEMWYVYKDRGRITKKDDKRTIRFVEATIFLGVFFAFFSTWRFPQYRMTETLPVFYVGIVFIWSGILFRFYCVHVLGKYFHKAKMIESPEEKTRSGPYRFIRYPAYTASLLTLLGCGIALQNWVAIVCIGLFSFLGYLIRMNVEDALFVRQFGEAYSIYIRDTKRIIPFLY